MMTTTENTAGNLEGHALEIDVHRFRTGTFEARVRELDAKFPGIRFERGRDPMEGTTWLDWVPDGPPMSIPYRVVVPFATYRFGDHSLVGIIKDNDGRLMVWAKEDGTFSRDDVESIDFLRCDHCHSRRQRKALYIFATDAGDRVQIGTTCAVDYLGVDVFAELAKAATAVRRAFGNLDEWGEMGGGFKKGDPSFEYAVPVAVVLVEKFGYISGRKARDEDCESTADALFRMLNPKPSDPADVKALRADVFAAVTERRDDLRAETAAYADTVRAELAERWTEFRHNLAQNLEIATHGMAAFMGSDVVRRRAKDDGGRGKPLALDVSTKMADLGTFEVKFVRSEPGQYGTSFLHVAKTDDGSTVMFRKSKDPLLVGDVIALRGKVKKHLDTATVIGYARPKVIEASADRVRERLGN